MRLPTSLRYSLGPLLTIIQTGLFAPRQGQAYREEQRRRRSQYDRGTPGAEMELQQPVAMYQAMNPLQPGINNFRPPNPRRPYLGQHLYHPF